MIVCRFLSSKCNIYDTKGYKKKLDFHDGTGQRKIGDAYHHTKDHEEIHRKKAVFTTYQYHLLKIESFLSVLQAP